MSWDALGTVGLRAVSTSQVLWQGCSRRAVAIPAWDLGVFCSGLWGCPAWVSLKAGSSRGPGRAAGSQQAVLLLPTAQGVHAGKVGAGHCAPQRSACPGLRTGQPRAGPSCAWSPSQLCLQLEKAPFTRQSSPHLPQRPPARSCLPCLGKPPIPAVTTAPTRREQEWSLPVPGEGSWHWPCSVQGLCCAREEGCAGWGDLLSQ